MYGGCPSPVVRRRLATSCGRVWCHMQGAHASVACQLLARGPLHNRSAPKCCASHPARAASGVDQGSSPCGTHAPQCPWCWPKPAVWRARSRPCRPQGHGVPQPHTARCPQGWRRRSHAACPGPGTPAGPGGMGRGRCSAHSSPAGQPRVKSGGGTLSGAGRHAPSGQAAHNHMAQSVCGLKHAALTLSSTALCCPGQSPWLALGLGCVSRVVRSSRVSSAYTIVRFSRTTTILQTGSAQTPGGCAKHAEDRPGCPWTAWHACQKHTGRQTAQRSRL